MAKKITCIHYGRFRTTNGQTFTIAPKDLAELRGIEDYVVYDSRNPKMKGKQYRHVFPTKDDLQKIFSGEFGEQNASENTKKGIDIFD